ncbi:MAG TPA: ABC transporter permease [Phycisphaerae bacterium]|nr:ABC transporter permease [Phycisphaerae bacterium]
MSATSLMRLLERVGAQGEGFLAYLGGLGYLGLDTLRQTVAGLVSRPRIKADETFYQMVRLGVRAVPIIFLVQFFVGMTLSFTLAPVLADYGQLDQLATVIAKAVFPQLGPLIAAVVLTGFAGAAIAAELGTMVVGEEIAALRTSAIHPIRFLVVPRVIACVLTTIALTVLANVVGTAGGGLVAWLVLDIDPWQYYHTAVEALLVKDVATGLIKGAIFGFIIVTVSCYEGLSVSGGAGGVGRATTSSVVRSIFLIIAANCVFTALFYFLW